MKTNPLTRVFRNWKLLCTAFIGLSVLAGCSDNDEPAGNPDNPDNPGQVYFADDLLNGGMVYVAEYSDEAGFRIPVKLNKPVNFKVCGDSPFSVAAENADDGCFLSGRRPGALSGRHHVLVMRAENKENPADFRHFIVLLVNRDAAPRKVPARSNSANMTQAYGDLIGMGTQSFEMLGNTKRAVLQSSLIPIEDQNLVTSQVLDITEMFELSGESFKSSMSNWTANLGLSMKGLSKKNSKWKLSGSFDFNLSGSLNTSDDFEYYMNIYKVVRGEIAYNMKEFENMAVSDEKDDVAEFLSYVSAGFIRDVMEVENEKLVTQEFFDTWGTDMISQTQIGGFKIYMYGRETNIYEHSIGFDASLDLKRSTPQTPTMQRQWFDIYMAKNSPYLGGDLGGSYMTDDYFKASKCMKYSLAVGGNPSLGDNPDSWIAGFESMDGNVKWQPVSYRRYSDSAVPGQEDIWCLYPIEFMGTNVINAVEKSLGGEDLSKQDSLIIDNARRNIITLEDAKKAYIERYLTYPAEASRLVLCDVMMKHHSAKQKSGQPEPFVGKDDAGKLRTYYPMMANKFFDKARATEHQRGRAIDTNVGCFISGVPSGSHYWYYALAHENDCTGIVDITFYDHLEDYFVYRGDAASDGSGLLNYAKRVCVKYFDPGAYKPEHKITAFGIYDDHHEVNNIIASTGGSELPIEATESKYNDWVEFWNGARDHHNWPKYAFYHGGGAIPHGIYVKFTTKTLPINNIKEVKHPDKY